MEQFIIIAGEELALLREDCPSELSVAALSRIAVEFDKDGFVCAIRTEPETAGALSTAATLAIVKFATLERRTRRRIAAGAVADGAPATGGGSAGKPEEDSADLFQSFFKTMPVAFCISTSGFNTSRYVEVNRAYLELLGEDWSNLELNEMVSTGHVVDDSGRRHRLERLTQEGCYVAEIGCVRHASGAVLPVRLTARRVFVEGQLYDYEILSPVS